ncbi:hypothetical protein C0J52_19390 [Blattella germanica]|nr:hypothetical protein C0J52_19390 [Blattella germanica]
MVTGIGSSISIGRSSQTMEEAVNLKSGLIGIMDLDEVLDEVGHFGKFQAINYLLIGIPILLSAIYALCYVFTAGDLEYRIGRKTALVASIALAGVMGLARSFAWNYESFLVFEFLDPALGSGIYTSGFILSLELVGPRARVLGGTLISVFYAFGEALLGGVAWWLQNWRHILRVLYVPALLCLSYYWLLPESVRWLLAKGKTEQAKAIINRVAKTNGVNLSEQILSKLEVTGVSEDKSEKSNKTVGEVFKQVLHSKILLTRVITCSFCWITITFVFYGLSLTSVSVGGNKFTSFILTAFIELPAYIVFYFTMDRFGRKLTLSASLMLSGICCISFAFIPTDMDWAQLVLFLAGKFAITISFTVVYVYTAEIFPTELRQSLLGVCATFGRIGSVIAPQTPLLSTPHG